MQSGWTQARLLAAVRRHWRLEAGAANRTFVVGSGREDVVISTNSSHYFSGQRPGDDDEFEGALGLDKATLRMSKSMAGATPTRGTLPRAAPPPDLRPLRQARPAGAPDERARRAWPSPPTLPKSSPTCAAPSAPAPNGSSCRSHALGHTLGERLALRGHELGEPALHAAVRAGARDGGAVPGRAGIDPVPDGLGPALIARLLLDLPASTLPTYFRPLAEQPGMGDALWATLRELRMAGVTAADLTPASSRSRPRRPSSRPSSAPTSGTCATERLADRAPGLPGGPAPPRRLPDPPGRPRF